MNPYESGPFGADPMPPLPNASAEHLRSLATYGYAHWPSETEADIRTALRYCAAVKERAGTEIETLRARVADLWPRVIETERQRENSRSAADGYKRLWQAAEARAAELERDLVEARAAFDNVVLQCYYAEARAAERARETDFQRGETDMYKGDYETAVAANVANASRAAELERQLAVAVKALEPFGDMSATFSPGSDANTEVTLNWQGILCGRLKIGHFRAAARALASIQKDDADPAREAVET